MIDLRPEALLALADDISEIAGSYKTRREMAVGEELRNHLASRVVQCESAAATLRALAAPEYCPRCLRDLRPGFETPPKDREQAAAPSQPMAGEPVALLLDLLTQSLLFVDDGSAEGEGLAMMIRAALAQHGDKNG
jgi:hypothetical protein